MYCYLNLFFCLFAVDHQQWTDFKRIRFASPFFFLFFLSFAAPFDYMHEMKFERSSSEHQNEKRTIENENWPNERSETKNEKK